MVVSDIVFSALVYRPVLFPIYWSFGPARPPYRDLRVVPCPIDLDWLVYKCHHTQYIGKCLSDALGGIGRVLETDFMHLLIYHCVLKTLSLNVISHCQCPSVCIVYVYKSKGGLYINANLHF